MGIRIITEKLSVKNPIIVEGFPGVGLVGSIAAKYLVQEIKAKQIGFVQSNHLPPVSFVFEGQIYNPIRIHESKKYNMLIIESEFPVPGDVVHELGDAIADWSKKIGASKLICLEGINNPKLKNKPSVFIASSGNKKDYGIEQVKSGYIIGVSASMMLRAKEINMPGICLMVESHVGYPDGMAAATLLQKLSNMLTIKLDVQPLEKEAEQFEKQVKTLVEKAHEIKTMSKDGKVIYG